MVQSEYVPRGYTAESSAVSSGSPIVTLISKLATRKGDKDFRFTFQPIRRNLFRTTFTSKEHPIPPHGSAIPPKVELDVEKIKASSGSETSRSIHTGHVTANIEWKVTPIVTLTLDGESDPIHTDLPDRSYVADGTGVAHYSRYKRHTLHVGLGEKPAPMDLSNRHFVLSATDCFGYDVHRTDPMYKHIPLLINATPKGVVGIFSTSHARGTFSVGSEMDGLWGHFKVYRQQHGGLEQYLIVGRRLEEVVRTYADVVGYPMLAPRWAFGYLAGGMKYSMLDEPRASDALYEFADKLKKHDIPCSGFQMSSGYTIAEKEPKTRNVFTWNYHRFPDPKAFIDEYHRRGIRLIFNIKPYVLGSHPEYQKLKDANAFFTDPNTDASAEAYLWSAGGGESGIGGHLDFTSKAGYEWWYNGVKGLRELGVDCMWNDNNEYTVPDDYWTCKLDEKNVRQPDEDISNHLGLWGRALNTELMGKSSHDALLEVAPNVRPFVLTRSATAGSMRYCCSSWSGDNVTSWDGMRGANALALTAGMCLMQCYGHDIGGFEGSQPSPELLVRWIQIGIYSSRFAINCFKTSPENNNVGDVIEPWMYPEVTHIIRDTIKRRYELLPYIYSLALKSHMTAVPPQRWTGWGYESDPEVWTNKVLKDGETQYWLGDSLLVGGVYEPGVSTARVYLPRGGQYLNTNKDQEYFFGGQWVDIESPWDKYVPAIAKVGGAIPVGKDVQVRAVGDRENVANLPEDDYRGVEIFPPKGGSGDKAYKNTWYEDDGISNSDSTISEFTINYKSSDVEIAVTYDESLKGGFLPPWKKLSIILPAGEQRDVSFNGDAATFVKTDKKGRNVYESKNLR